MGLLHVHKHTPLLLHYFHYFTTPWYVDPPETLNAAKNTQGKKNGSRLLAYSDLMNSWGPRVEEEGYRHFGLGSKGGARGVGGGGRGPGTDDAFAVSMLCSSSLSGKPFWTMNGFFQAKGAPPKKARTPIQGQLGNFGAHHNGHILIIV